MKLLWVRLLAFLAIPQLSLADDARLLAGNNMLDELQNATQRRTTPDPNDVFGEGGPLFNNFDPNNNNLNAVKAAILEAVLLAKRALPHVWAQSSIYRRYFQPTKQARVEQIYLYLYGEGRGPRAMGAADWPLRFVWLDSRFIGIPWEQNPCEKYRGLYASFYTNPPDKRSPAILLCSNVFFGPNVVKLSLGAWSKVHCNNIPDFMDGRLITPALTILHELTHWTSETKKITGCETFPVLVNDYGVNKDGLFDDVAGLPKHGYGAYNCMKINQRADLDSSVNADTYAWMAMEAWLNHQCPGRAIREPAPAEPAEYPNPRHRLPP